MSMLVRTRLTAGLLVAGLAATVFAHAQGRGDSGPTCPPGQLCLRYESPGRLGRSVDPVRYAYPIHDPYLATITVAAMNPDGLTPGVRREVIRVPGLPGRDHVPLLEGRNQVGVALYRQRGPAPLVFILGGLGSNPFFGLATYYADLLHRHGAHVVILPSPMTWSFALTASESGAPGYAPDDARDLYRLMQTILALLRSRHGVEVTGVDFMGTSLGALEGAYLSVLDAERGAIGIRRYLLVNPPIELAYALGRLQEWEALGGRLGKERATEVSLRALGLVEDYMDDRRRIANASFQRATREFARFSTEELQFAIAQYLHLVLPELVYVTQAIHDQGVLAAPSAEGRKRLEAARAFTLKDYEERIAVPRRQLRDPGADGDSLNARGSLRAILDRLRANPRVHIMHNADDVLAERAAIEELKQVMGSRMTVYPRGGHLGNLWHAENQEDILRFFGAAASGPARSRPPRS